MLAVLKTIGLAGVQLVALLGAVAALGLGVSLIAPQSRFAQAAAGAAPLAEVRWQTAERNLMESSPTAVSAALAQADAEVAAAPNRLQPYMQRAFIRTRAAGGALSPGALADFAHTYDLSPADFSVAVWRARFAYTHWSELTTDIRIKVMAEHRLAWNLEQADFAALEGDINNGAGRLAYRLTQRNAEADFWAAQKRAKGG